jgi:tetratricopeptide (TPR) repeat protein
LILRLLEKDAQARCSVSQFRAHLSQIAKEQQIVLPTPLARTDDDELQELRAKSSIEGLKGGVREAFEAALEITRRWPEDTSGWTHLGRLYMTMGDFRKAHTATAKSLSLDDTRSAPWNNLGIIWGEFGEPEKAIMSFRMALDCDPSNTGPMLNLAKPLALLGRRSEAIAVLHEALALAPDKFAAWVNLAGYLWEDGQREPGLAALNRAPELSPADMKARIAEQLSDWTRKKEAGR